MDAETEVEPAGTRRAVLIAVLRCLITVVLLGVVYALVPIGQTSAGVIVLFVISCLVTAAALAWHLRQVVNASHPGLRGAEALVSLLFLTLFAFALTYTGISAADPGAFSEVLDKVSGVYFAVTVTSTVGFGDITPVNPPARLAVTAQMLVGIALLGGVLRLVTAAIARGRRCQGT